MEVVEPITTVSQSKNNDPQLLEAYIGKRAGKYIAAQNFFDSTNEKTYWNWSSALLGPIWPFHRRLYGLSALYMLYFILFPSLPVILLMLMDCYNFALYDLIITLSYILGIGLAVIMGFFGSYIYLNKVQKNIFKYKYLARDKDELIDMLKKEGNPSVQNLIVGIILFSIVLIISFAVSFILGAGIAMMSS